MSLVNSDNLSAAFLDDLFDQYDSIKKGLTGKERAFSDKDYQRKSSLSSSAPGAISDEHIAPLSSPLPRRGGSTSWKRDPLNTYSRANIRSCIISIRKWYSDRSAGCLPALIPDHKCTLNCHKDNGPLTIHRKPLVLGCELSGILHYCGPKSNSTCEWTHTDPRTCSKNCVFAINKVVGEWITAVDTSYANFKAAKSREVSQGYDDYVCPDDDNLVNTISGDTSLFGDIGDSHFCDEDFGTWDDLDKTNTSPFDQSADEVGDDDPPLEGFGSERRIHNTIFESIHKQKACNTYNHARIKRRKKAKERARKNDAFSYNKSLTKITQSLTSIYLVETGIRGDAFYVCTPRGDCLGYLLGGKEIPLSDFPGDGIDPLCTPEGESSLSGSSEIETLYTSSGVRKPPSKLELEAKAPKGDVTMKEEVSSRLLTISQMEELDNQALHSEAFLKKFNEMSISLSIPVSTVGSDKIGIKKRRGPLKGYKKRFTNKVETVPGQDIGIIGFYDRYTVSGIPTFSNAQELQKYVEKEKKELGYLNKDTKRSEDLEHYNIYDILRDRVVEELNADIPGYLSKKDRYKMKHGNESNLFQNDLFKTPSPIPMRRSNPISSLSMSSPSLSGGTPIRSAPRQTNRSLASSASPRIMFGGASPMRGNRSFMTPTPSPMRGSSLFFGTSIDPNLAHRNISSPALMILSGSTPSRSMTPGSMEAGSDHIRWRGMEKDVSAMRKWPIGRTISQQTKVVEIVGEKVHRVIIDLLVDRGPRRSILTIRKLSRKDDFMRKAIALFNSHNSYKTKEGKKLPIPVNYHTLYTLWRRTCGINIHEKRPPEFPIEHQIAMKEMIVKCWMLLSRSEYSHGRNKKKASVFTFIVGMLYLMAYEGYTSSDGVVVIDCDPWLKDHLPTADDMDVLNKRKIGSKSNRGFSCKGNIASKSASVGALAPRDVKTFGQGTNRSYNRRIIGEGISLIKYLMNNYEKSGHGLMENVREYLRGGFVAIDKLIVVNPITHS